MSDQPGGPNDRLPAPIPPSGVSTERFTAPPSARQAGLTGERSAKIVRQSSNARWVSFLGILVVIIFVLGYYFYDVGLPGVAGGGRMAAETQTQQVTQIATGYQLFEANCARCHGTNGQGGIGPILNDQAKLLEHLTPQYIQNVLTVGGRYVCGNPNSLMPIWSDVNGGPLNYVDIQDLIAFIRASSDITYKATDPATGQTVTRQGWRNPNYAAPASATQVPDCWTSAFTSASSSPAASSGVSPSPSASGATSGVVLQLTAQNIAYDKSSLEAPANTAFVIDFTNNDAGVPHNVSIHQGSATGTEVFKGEIFPGTGSRQYQIPALPAGTYYFVCSVHPNMVGTLTVK